jgi:PBP1b-binding outer membrane lipoprotein LpoB
MEMNRTVMPAAVAVIALLLASCGTPISRTPVQVVQAAATKTSALKTAKIAMTADVSATVPGMNQTAPHTVNATIKGDGALEMPDNLQMAVTFKTEGLSIDTEIVVIAGTAYVKDPLSGKWKTTSLSELGFSAGASQLDPSTYTELMKAVKSVEDKQDTTIKDSTGAEVRVHHYRLTIDPAVLKDKVGASISNAKLKAAVLQYADTLAASNYTYEVWIGVTDDYVHRLTLDVSPGTANPGATPPADGGVTEALRSLKVHVTIDFRDFNGPVKITVPTVG